METVGVLAYLVQEVLLQSAASRGTLFWTALDTQTAVMKSKKYFCCFNITRAYFRHNITMLKTALYHVVHESDARYLLH